MRKDERYRRTWAILAALVFLIVVPSAFAHAILMESNPSSKSLVIGTHLLIWLRFNVRIDQPRSRLNLVGPDNSEQSLTIGKQTSADILTAQASVPLAGQYRIRWQVLASDGHVTAGEIPFTVK